MKSTQIDITNYNYELSDNQIAKYPAIERDSSKLLVYKESGISHSFFDQLPQIIPPGHTIVYNNTKVIHARIKFLKETGAKIEIFCLSPSTPVDYQLSLQNTSTCTWSCMVGNLKKWKGEILRSEFIINTTRVQLHAEKTGIDKKGNQLVKFYWNRGFTFADVLNAVGKIPIPPYLNRESESIDQNRYQTVYSQFEGSVAAPTAGLHFTSDIIKKLKENQIPIYEVTLHVGAGTFQPVKADNAREHKMHGEQINVDQHFIENMINQNKKIIATGTTSMRTLESLYWLGVKASLGKSPTHLMQWEWEKLPANLSKKESFSLLLEYLKNKNQNCLSAITEIMIVPGYTFKVVEALITNFHQPKSTLLLLIAAFIGERWKNIYNYAVDNNFKFLSYGDSSILFRE